MHLHQYLGDSVTHTVPLLWRGISFEPGNAWGLIWTAKEKTSDPDSAAVIQKASGLGITVTGSVASIALVPQDSAELAASVLVWDIQAQHLSTGEVRTVAFGRLDLARDVTRETAISIPVQTTEPPYPGGGDPAVAIHAADAKPLIADDDEFGMADSADAWSLKKAAWSAIKARLKAYFDPLYQAAGVTWSTLSGKPSTFAPSAHKSSHAIGGSDALTPADIGIVTSVGGNGADDAGKFVLFGGDGGITTSSDVGAAGFFESGSGLGSQSVSQSGTGASSVTETGILHHAFGTVGDNRSFVARVLGAFGWFRGLFTARIQAAATLTGNRTYTLPDATGNVLLDSTLAPTINAATEDTALQGNDRVPMTETGASGALRWMTLDRLFAFVRAQLGLMTSTVQAAGDWAFQSATRPTSAGTGTPAANSLITRADGDARLASPFSFTTGSPTTGPWGGNQLVLQPFCTGRPDITSCFVSTFASSPPDVRFVPFWVSTPRTVTTAVIRITAGTNATQTVRGAIYDVDANGMPNNRISPEWNFSCAATGVVTQAIGASVVLNRGLYWVALQNSVGGTLWGSPALTVHGYADGSVPLGQLNLLFGSLLSTFGQFSVGTVPTSFGGSSLPATAAGFPNRGNGSANVFVPLVGLY